MSKSRSLALALLLLLATLVAAAWGVARIERGSWGPAATETSFLSASRVCHFTPGHAFASPTAVEIAEARASWSRWHANTHVCWIGGDILGQPSADDLAQARSAAAHAYDDICVYDPSQGIRLLPTAHQAGEARHAAATVRDAGHAFGGRVVPLPSTDSSLVGIAIAAVAGIALLALRYLRRTAGAAASALETNGAAPVSRRWLTKRRVATVGAGWLLTMGVLAAAYPLISALIPRQQELPGDAPGAVQPQDATTTTTPYDPEDDADATDTPSASPSGTATDFTLPPPAPSGSNGGDHAAADSANSAQAALSAFAPGVAGGAGSATNSTDGESAADSSATPQAGGRATTSLAALSTYLPATTPVTTVTTGNSGASTGNSPTSPSTGTPSPASSTGASSSSPLPPNQPAGETAAADTPALVTTIIDSTQPALSATPIIDPANPLPSGPDAVIPAPAGNANATVPANPVNVQDDEGSTDVPEPAMLGLFGLATLALLRRRRV